MVTRTSVPAIVFLLTKRAFPHEEKPLTLFRLVKSEGRVLVKLLTAANHSRLKTIGKAIHRAPRPGMLQGSTSTDTP